MWKDANHCWSSRKDKLKSQWDNHYTLQWVKLKKNYYLVLVEFSNISGKNIKMDKYFRKWFGSFLLLNMQLLFKLEVLWYVF